MSVPALIESEAFENMEEVAKLHLQSLSPYQIARRLGIKVVEAKAAIAQWQEIVSNDMEARDAARDHLNDMVKRYELLMHEAQENLVQLKDMAFDEKVSAQINATLKNIADFDAKRVDMLQKAGLYDASEIGDQLAEREEREAKIIKILREDLCDDCRRVVSIKLQELTNTVEATVVYPDE